MPEEPTDNIGVTAGDSEREGETGAGADGGAAADDVGFDPGTAATRAEAVVDELGERYWTTTYGGRDAFECLIRTVLSQNTSDKASQPAHDALMARYGESEATRASEERPSDTDDVDLAESLAAATRDDLAETISSAGLYNRKSETMIRLAGRVVDEYGGAAGFDEFVRESDPEAVRSALLDMKGVGPKTADCVLLFAGGRDGVFPVDTHVHRVARRMGLAPPDADHEAVRVRLEADVPAGKCGFGHTATIQFGREYCSARKPACLGGLDACPLSHRCDRVGVDPDAGTVVDPAEAAEADADAGSEAE